MATFNITSNTYISNISGKAGQDTYNVYNNAYFIIDQHSRYGANNTTSTVLGPMNSNAANGGFILIDGRYNRLIGYNTGSGTVPASGTIISQGSASGTLVAVYSALNAAPTAAAAAMPATGLILINKWNSTEYTSGSLTGITATANGASSNGWVEVVGAEAATITLGRTSKFITRGSWFDLGFTSGVNTTTYQIPSNGGTVYAPGVYVETANNSGVYEIYPCAGSLTALAANFSTDARSKVCFIATTGLVRFQHDGTNSTGGYLPPSGLRVRIPNIFLQNCTTAAPTTNSLPNATLATRYDFTGSGISADLDTTNCAWFLSFAQPYSIQLTNVLTFEQILLSELASTINWTGVGVGQCAAQAQFGLSLTTCLAGGTIANSCFTSATLAASGRYILSFQDITGFNFYDTRVFSLVARGNATTGNSTLTRVKSSSYTRCSLAVGRQLLTTCDTITYSNTTYWDNPTTSTTTTNPMYMFDMLTNTLNITVDGVSFGGYGFVQPYSGLMNVGAAGCSGIKVRNLGSYNSPLSLGGTEFYGATWTRVTSTITVTTLTPHGFKATEPFYVFQSSDTAPITIGSKTVGTVTSSTVFTFTGSNSGSSSGTISFVATMSGYLAVFAANAVASNFKFQRCYTKNTRTGMVSWDNSSKNIIFENCMADYFTTAFVTAGLNAVTKGIHHVHQMTAQSNPVYGSNWFDTFTGGNSANTTPTWTRSTTTATISCTQHKLRTGELILVTTSSDRSAIVLGQKSVTVTGNNTFTFTCLNAGAASGTLVFENLNGRIGLLMNEPSPDTSSQVTYDNGSPIFNAAGGLYAPNVNDTITFEMAGAGRYSTGSGGYLLGYSGFNAANVVLTGGTTYDLYYSIDKNDGNGYSAYKNLNYARTVTSGSNNTKIDLVSVAGLSVNDYVFGTNTAGVAKITNIYTGNNQIELSANNQGTVSGTLVFSQLPNEIVSESSGFKLKIRANTNTLNTNTLTSLYLFAKNTETGRTYQYTLDTVNLTLTGLQANSDINIMTSGTITQILEVDQNATSSYVWTYDSTLVGTSIDIGIMLAGYVPFYIRSYTLGSTDTTLPIAQVADRNYI